MAVFDGSIKTQRRVDDPITDKQISSVASLTMMAIHTPTALLYPGSDVSVVHGIQHLQVDNDRIMQVDMNHNVTVGANEIYRVDMNRSMTVMANYARNVMANSTINVTGNYDKSVLSNYSKSITGNSLNAITGSYWKTVSTNYSKSVTGNADNQITGNYSKSVQSTYTKAIVGTSTTTVTGNYSKTLQSDYSKAVTGTSTIKVTGTSDENYNGDHSRKYCSNHKTYIVGDDNHTTLGSTLWSKIGPKIFGQCGAHHQQHDDTSQEEREGWFKTTAKEGLLVGEQIELVVLGQCFTANKTEFTRNSFEGTFQTLAIKGFDHGYTLEYDKGLVVKSEEAVSHEDLKAIKEDIGGLSTRLSAMDDKTHAMRQEIGAMADRGQPVNIFIGALFGANQWCM